LLCSSHEFSLAEIFACKLIEENWHLAKSRIDALGISNEAGGVNLGDRRALFYLVKYLRPTSILEIGTHIGASTVSMASALEVEDRAKDAKSARLVTVDIIDVNDAVKQPWRQFGTPHSPQQLLESLGCDERVEFVTLPSLQYLSRTENNFDLIFLDGDHGAATVYREVPAALAKLRPGGVIVLHDYFPHGQPLWRNGAVVPGPWLALDRLQREGNPFQVCPLGTLPWPTKLDSNVSSLAVLLKRVSP